MKLIYTYSSANNYITEINLEINLFKNVIKAKYRPLIDLKERA